MNPKIKLSKNVQQEVCLGTFSLLPVCYKINHTSNISVCLEKIKIPGYIIFSSPFHELVLHLLQC